MEVQDSPEEVIPIKVATKPRRALQIEQIDEEPEFDVQPTPKQQTQLTPGSDEVPTPKQHPNISRNRFALTDEPSVEMSSSHDFNFSPRAAANLGTSFARRMLGDRKDAQEEFFNLLVISAKLNSQKSCPAIMKVSPLHHSP